MITLLDYGAGNVRSVINAVKKFDDDVRIVSSPEDILSAGKLIFPGVGHFGNMIKILKEKGYFDPLKTYLEQDRPFLGICLGFHALFEWSEEFPDIPGLSLFPGYVKHFTCERSVPHIGWNTLNIKKQRSLLQHIPASTRFYFVHSFHVVTDASAAVLTTTDYGYEFVSAVSRGNISGTQFHPEKSGFAGLKVLENFIARSGREQIILNPTPKDNVRPDQSGGLSRRIIACLDVRTNDDGDLVVTKGDQYDVRERGNVRNLGKPVELAKFYFDQGADEITFLNITGFRDFPLEDLPMIAVLEKTSENVFVPLTIGGGIRDYTDANGRYYSALEVAAAYFRAGADKISIGSDAVLIAENYLKSGKRSGKSAIETISDIYGSQAVVVSIDPLKKWLQKPHPSSGHHIVESSSPGPSGEKYCWYQCTIKGGREGRDVDAVTLAAICQDLGAGEILLNSIERDGTNAGFDLDLVNCVKNAVSIPVIASSGAGHAGHFLEVFCETDVESALAAGIFHRREVSVAAVKQHLSRNRISIRI